MANYFVADGSPSTGTGNIVSVSQGQFTIDLGATFNVGDVVHYGGTVGVIQDIFGAEHQCGYDDRIYAVPSGSGSFSVYANAALTAEGITKDVSSYRIITDIQQAYYSQSYVKFNTTKLYSLVITNDNRLDLGDFNLLIQKNPLYIVDDCTYIDGAAYKLAIESSTIDSFNNKFKNTIEFRLVAQ